MENKENPSNSCIHLKPLEMPLLPTKDALKIIIQKQAELQERLGRMALYRKADMVEKCDYIKDSIINVNMEFAEMLERLPFKHWKRYPKEMKKGWVDDDQRTETLFEYIDALHFFINIGLILSFSPEEIFNGYMAKNKENFDRQDRGY